MDPTTHLSRGNRVVTRVFVGLALLTALSWSLAERDGRPGEPSTADAITVVLVVSIAAVKLRLVGMCFMELKDAPVALRLAFDAWIVIVSGLIIGLRLLVI